MEKNQCDFGFSDKSSDITPKAHSMKEKIDKLDFIKIYNFCSMNETVKRTQTQATAREKIFTKCISDKRLVSKMKYSTTGKQTIQFKNVQNI